MTGTIYAQVSEWLAARHWDVLSDHRGRLAWTWDEVAAKYGDESPAACRVLLALVREAWGHGDAVAVSSEVFQGQCCVTQRFRNSQNRLPARFVAWGHSEVEALTAALMAAPKKAGEP